MPRASAFTALILAAAVAACGGGDRGDRPAPPAGTGNPRVAAAFEDLMRASILGAEQARLRQAEAVIQARIEEGAAAAVVDGSRDSIVVDLPPVSPDLPAGDDLAAVLAGVPEPFVDVRFRRGMNGFPTDRLDDQAEAARRAVERCAGDVDRTISLTVHLDAGHDPPIVRVAGAQGLDGCVERELYVHAGHGEFIAVVRVSP